MPPPTITRTSSSFPHDDEHRADSGRRYGQRHREGRHRQRLRRLAATGNVITNDTDPDAGDTKTVTAVSFGPTNGTLGTALTGAYGSLVLNASGAFTYTVNENAAAVQALRHRPTPLTDVFNYTMRDTAGATSSTTLTVTIQGANDAPVLAVQTGNQSATVGSAFSLALPAGTFTDVDGGDTLTYAATAADGRPLPAWLAFNAATRTFSGTPAAANLGTLGVKVSATDLGSLTTSETFNIAVLSTPNIAPTAVADTGIAVEKGGIANGSGGLSPIGNVTHQRHRSRRGRHEDRHRGAVRQHERNPRHRARRRLRHPRPQCLRRVHLHGERYRAAVQALRQPTDTLNDVFTYTMRDTAGATSTATLTATIQGANDAPVLAAQTSAQTATVGSPFYLTLPADDVHGRRCDRHPDLHRDGARRDVAAVVALLQRRDAHLHRHSRSGQCRHAGRQGHGHRYRRPERQRDLQHRRLQLGEPLLGRNSGEPQTRTTPVRSNSA